MTDDGGDARTDRLSKRFNGGGSQESESRSESEGSDSSDGRDAGGDDGGEDGEKWVNMKLPENLVKDLDLAYRRMDLEARERADVGIEKNADFYPVVIRAGLDQVDVDDVLGASDSAEGDE